MESEKKKRAPMRRLTDEDRKVVGNNIKVMMVKNGLTQSEIQELTKIKQSVISRYVNGKCDMRTGSLLTLCDVLKCTPNDIMAGTFDEQADG